MTMELSCCFLPGGKRPTLPTADLCVVATQNTVQFRTLSNPCHGSVITHSRSITLRAFMLPRSEVLQRIRVCMEGSPDLPVVLTPAGSAQASPDSISLEAGRLSPKRLPLQTPGGGPQWSSVLTLSPSGQGHGPVRLSPPPASGGHVWS